MIFTFFFICFRRNFDDNFVRKVTDKDFDSIIKRYKEGFLFFHHVGSLVSDTGYLRFVDVARKYQNLSHFFLANPFIAPRLCREMQVDGYPSLYYLFNSTKHSELFGAFTNHNLESFISKFINSSIPQIVIDENNDNSPTKAPNQIDAISRLIKLANEDGFDDSNFIFIFADQSSKFGRTAIQLAKEIQNKDFNFYQINKPMSQSPLNLRFPTILFIRKGDHAQFIYNGESTLLHMMNWLKSILRSKIVHFSPPIFFTNDGSSQRTIVRFYKNNDIYQTMDEMTDLSKSFPTTEIAHAEISQYMKYAKLFNIENGGQICIESNYTHFTFARCSTKEEIQNFLQNKLEKKTVYVPAEAYNYLVRGDESAFHSILKQGPAFVAFSATPEYCDECANFEKDLSLAIRKIGAILQMNSTLTEKDKPKWMLWKITSPKNAPSFKNELSLKIPSLYYFPSATNLTKSVQFRDTIDYLSIVEWANNQMPFLDIFEFLQRESIEKNNPYDAL